MTIRDGMGRIGKIAQNKKAKRRHVFGILLLTFGKKVGKIAEMGKRGKKKKKLKISKFSC